jgi:hypothetical protein
MEDDLEGDLALRLVKVIAAQRKIRKRNTSLSALLWHAARSELLPCCDAVMTSVEKDYPAKKRAPHHLAELLRRIDRETDLYVDQTVWGGTVLFPAANELVEDFAARNILGKDDGTKPIPLEKMNTAQADAYRYAKKEDVYLEFRDSANALQKVVRRLGLDLRATKRKKTPLMNRCDLCWRTGFRNGRAAYLCSIHQSGTAAYKKAIRLRQWRDPSQPAGNYSSLQLMTLKEIDPDFIMGFGRRYGFPENLLSGLLPDSQTPSLGVMMNLEVAYGAQDI